MRIITSEEADDPDSTLAQPSSTFSPGAAPAGTALWFLKPMAWNGRTVFTSRLTCSIATQNV
ncbi:MAG: hypothetical protein FRX49_05312 [Trebouxia sp. A1-2]|nr:MAG: hypothetical protein FRX49_05312 [Trebouxia sp. A1-2]